MKSRSILGTHLYHQIVYPLLAASVIVGIVATVVAVYFLEDLTGKWVTQAAQSASANMAFRYNEYARQMQREALLVAGGDSLGDALRRGSPDELREQILVANASLGFDSATVLDERGVVIASVGPAAFKDGERPFGDTAALVASGPHSALVDVAGRSHVAVFQPIRQDGLRNSIVVTRRIDDDLLGLLGVGSGQAFCFYDPRLKDIACVVGDEFDDAAEGEILNAIRAPGRDLTALLEKVRKGETASGTLRSGGSTYRMWAQRAHLPFSSPRDEAGYVVGFVSQSVSQQAGATTRNLIAMWSVVAVVALVGLGGWVARRVSDPLVELSAGAHRIAEGDFSTKVRVVGVNEISELAETFNGMSDSLRERSESLTKKVLELATLYEMSRALGSTLDMDELLGSVLESALRIFDLDLGYVVLRDRDSGTMGVRALRGGSETSADGAVRSSMSEWVLREGRPLIFTPDSAVGTERVEMVTGARAALCVPLTSAEGTIGSITIGSSRSDYRFSSDDVRLLSTIANHVTIAIGNIELFSSLQEAYLATVRSLAAAVDAKDSYTRGHSDRVATYSTMIAERMGLAHEQRIALEMAAYLHDIGKIGVREDILLKPGRLDDDEMTQMRHHPLIGANILKPVAFPWAITPIVRHHHEGFDGGGYPAGLRGDEIPLLARILTVADSFEAMTADRPYRAGRSVDEAVQEMEACSGTQFDPRIVKVFIEILHEFEEKGETVLGAPGEDVSPEEARAIFAALADGVFSSFRRLGGPRLAANAEKEVDEYLESQTAPFRVERGRIVFTQDISPDFEGEIVQMRETLRYIDQTIGRVSGSTLVDHFYSDAFEGFSGRMRHLARALDLCDEPWETEKRSGDEVASRG